MGSQQSVKWRNYNLQGNHRHPTNLGKGHILNSVELNYLRSQYYGELYLIFNLNL